MPAHTPPSASPLPGPEQAPNCWQCRFFRITHVPAMPYGCSFMGFQSRTLPCIEVLRADGMTCRAYAPKAQAANKA